MKVSFYELLGMIKENKQPKKVIYDDVVYMWTKNGYEKKDVIMPSLIVVENKSLRCKINDNKMFDKNITILEFNEEVIEENEIIEIKQEYTSKGKLQNYLNYQGKIYHLSIPQVVLFKEIKKIQNKLIK